MALDVRSCLGGEAEVDDGAVAHLLDFCDRAGRDGAGARHGRFDAREVADTLYFLPDHLLRNRQVSA